MYIYGTAHVHAPQTISGPHRAQSTAAPSSSSFSGLDTVDISPEAQLLSQARDLPEIRADRVAAIKAQIASGTYETDAKLDAALENLLDEFA
ncbi:anti-sigma-28 factor, FlgM [Pirellula staleyi DSM 6068]|uniref:Negative regulator of flagellin synthesis n=1 Tax=Pirellula staleyi (strain ATCC 27377 / DSM 6068 / ICPB 4128) TaxID=530564 RepID=D2R253_PIRSD|nr:anti-sigma-28 factor, FlgM [Pirellula staleyi DSM 6068]